MNILFVMGLISIVFASIWSLVFLIKWLNFLDSSPNRFEKLVIMWMMAILIATVLFQN